MNAQDFDDPLADSLSRRSASSTDLTRVAPGELGAAAFVASDRVLIVGCQLIGPRGAARAGLRVRRVEQAVRHASPRNRPRRRWRSDSTRTIPIHSEFDAERAPAGRTARYAVRARPERPLHHAARAADVPGTGATTTATPAVRGCVRATRPLGMQAILDCHRPPRAWWVSTAAEVQALRPRRASCWRSWLRAASSPAGLRQVDGALPRRLGRQVRSRRRARRHRARPHRLLPRSPRCTLRDGRHGRAGAARPEVRSGVRGKQPDRLEAKTRSRSSWPPNWTGRHRRGSRKAGLVRDSSGTVSYQRPTVAERGQPRHRPAARAAFAQRRTIADDRNGAASTPQDRQVVIGVSALHGFVNARAPSQFPVRHRNRRHLPCQAASVRPWPRPSTAPGRTWPSTLGQGLRRAESRAHAGSGLRAARRGASDIHVETTPESAAEEVRSAVSCVR